MKTLLSLALLFTIVHGFSQQDNSLVGAKWKDGTYSYEYNNSRSGWDITKGKDKKCSFQTENGKLISVDLDGEYQYTSDLAIYQSDEARFFMAEGSSWNLFFTKDKIIVFKHPNAPRVIGAIGGKLKKSDQELLEKHLESFEDKIAEFEQAKSNLDIYTRWGDIVDVKVKHKPDGILKSGDVVEFYYEYQLNDGTSLTSMNSPGGGSVDEHQLGAQIEGVEYVDYNNNPWAKKIAYCDDLDSGRVKVAILNEDTYDWYITYFDIDCIRDPEVVEDEKRWAIEKANAAKREEEINSLRDNIVKNNKSKTDQLIASHDERRAQNISNHKTLFDTKTDNQLFYFNALKEIPIENSKTHPLALVRDGSGFIQLHAYSEVWPKSKKKFDKNITLPEFGFMLSKHNESGDLTKFGDSFSVDYEDIDAGIIDLQVTDYGYIAASPEGMAFYNKDLKLIHNFGTPSGYKFAEIAPISGTTQTAILVLHSNSYLGLNIYDHKDGSWVYSSSLPVYKGYVEDKGNSLQMEILDNKSLFIAFSTSNPTVHFKKYDIELLQSKAYEKDEDAALFDVSYSNIILSEMHIDKAGFLRGTGYIEASNAPSNYYGLQFFEFDAAMNTADDFKNSGVYKAYKAESNPIPYPLYAKQVGNLTAILGMGNPSMEINVSVVAFYDYEWNFVGLYKFEGEKEKIEFDYELEMILPRVPNIISSTNIVSSYTDHGPEFKPYENDWEQSGQEVRDNIAWRFNEFWNTFDIASISDSEYIVMNPDGLLRVSIKDPKVCDLKTTFRDPVADKEASDAAYAAYEAAQQPTSDPLDEKNKITIVNDLGDSYQRYLRDDIVIELDGGTGNDGNLGVRSIPQGSYIRVECDTERILNEDGVTKYGRLEDYCGQTIRLSQIW